MFYNQDTGNPRFDMARNIAGRIRVNSDLQNPTLFWNNALVQYLRRRRPISPLPTRSPTSTIAARRIRCEYLFNVQRAVEPQLGRRSRLSWLHQP